MTTPKKTNEARAEYEQRDLLVGRAIGVRAGLEATFTALKCQKRPAKWLVNRLQRELDRMEGIASEMAKHRDEMYEAAWKDAF
jgi:hypothetical protein